jgi:peptidyl-prolyl cis-trans isomerase D
MLEAVRKNKRIAQLILAIIIIPFAFFGMDSYFSDGPAGAELASVGGTKISAAEFDRALREQQDRLRESMGESVDRAMLESEELRRAVLENLVNQRMLALHAATNRMVVTQQQLQEVIASLPAFQSDGRFSLERYENVLRAQGMSPAMFEARLGQDLRVQQLAQSVSESSFAAAASARRFLAAQLEEREIRELRFAPADVMAEVKLADDAAQRFYDANPARFERPARVRAQYVVFDEAALLEQVSVSDEAVQQFYAANPDRFGEPEQRRARHILIPAGSSPDEEAQARDKATAILARLRSEPARFEELAKAESQDTGSAERGGDLGYFGRGAMAKPFEDAAFGLEKGQLSEPVRSEFGFHIIEVTEIRPATVRPLDAVREEIAGELRSQQASRRFAELADQFANTTYEQSDSLQPVADLLKLEVRQTDWIERDGGKVGPFENEKLLTALFSDDAVKHKRNVEAVEVARGTMVSARVLEFEAAQRLPFDAVRAIIEQQLRAEEATRLVRERGEAALAAVSRGEQVAGEWSAPRKLQRGKPALPAAATQAVFQAPSGKLPAHAGAAMTDGSYAVFRIEKVERPELAGDDPRVKAIAEQYERLMAERDFSAFLAALREQYEVVINTAALNPRQQ